MRTVKVKKDDLHAKLLGNREEHRNTLDKALDGYRKEAIRQLDKMLERVKSNRKVPRVLVSLPIPEDHTDDYDRALEMLSWEVDDTVVLTEQEFAQFVQDDWGWKDAWTQTTSSYLAQ